MISSPACHFFPTTQVTLAILPARGGNLARRNQIQPGLFLYPSRTSPRALCSVRLTRDARSPRAGGLHAKGANRAACMGEGEAFSGPLPSSSLCFHEAAHQLRAHDSNRNQALASLGLGDGAAGSVMRIPPRHSILIDVNDPSHARNSFGSSSRKRKPNKERFSCVQNLVAQ